MGKLAFSLWFYSNPDRSQIERLALADRSQAERLASEAVRMGNPSGEAQKVLEAVKEQKEREKKEQIERIKREEESRKQKIYDSALRKANTDSIPLIEEAISELSEIEGWKENISKLICVYRNKIQKIIDSENKRKEEAIKQESRNKVMIILFIITGLVLISFELKSLAPPSRNALDEPPVFLFMFFYSFIVAVGLNIVPEVGALTNEEVKLRNISAGFKKLGLANVIVYTIAYVIKRIDFGAVIMFPLVWWGSMTVSMGIAGLICGNKRKYTK